MSTFKPENEPYYNPSKDRRVALITGGNSGIGFYSTLHLYLHGFIVYVAGRNKERVLTAIESIKKEAKERVSRYSDNLIDERPLGELRYLSVDLLDLSSVDKAASEFKEKETYLNLLIHNAGVMAVPFELSKDKFEVQMQTNCISPLLLTDKLFPLIYQPEVKDPRVIFLSSIGHHLVLYHARADNLLTCRFTDYLYFTWLRYGNTKLTDIYIAKVLAKRYPNVLSVSVHPGFVVDTRLYDTYTKNTIINFVSKFTLIPLGRFFGVNSEQGSYSTLKASLDQNLTKERDNGKYYTVLGDEVDPSKIAQNEDYANKWWVWAIKELGDRGYNITL